MSINADVLRQLDLQISRARNWRAVVAVNSPMIFLFAGMLVGSLLSQMTGIPRFISVSIWTGISAYCAVWAILRSTVVNSATSACVTVNQLASLSNLDPIVCYGPGRHFCFWWEERANENTVNHEEVAESFQTEVLLPDGTLTISGSVRLRADITKLHTFIGSAARLTAEDVTGLIVGQILEYTSERGNTLMSVLANPAVLNAELNRKFKRGGEQANVVSLFEERFGLIVGDVVVEKILASEKVRETISASTEAHIIDLIVARSFGMVNAAELEAAVQSNKVPRREVTLRRNQTLALSGNLQGMRFEEKNLNVNLDVSGLADISPDLANAISAAAPALAAFVASKKGGAQ